MHGHQDQPIRVLISASLGIREVFERCGKEISRAYSGVKGYNKQISSNLVVSAIKSACMLPQPPTWLHASRVMLSSEMFCHLRVYPFDLSNIVYPIVGDLVYQSFEWDFLVNLLPVRVWRQHYSNTVLNYHPRFHAVINRSRLATKQRTVWQCLCFFNRIN